jgi:hypothetical protein
VELNSKNSVGDDFGLGDFQTLDGDGMLVGS